MSLTEQSPADRPFLDDRALAAAVYVYLLALGTAFTALIGLVIAYLARPLADEITRTHFTFQIRTVVIGLCYVVVGAVLTIVWVGYLILAWWYLWSLIRGLARSQQAAVHQNPQSWMFG